MTYNSEGCFDRVNGQETKLLSETEIATSFHFHTYGRRVAKSGRYLLREWANGLCTADFSPSGSYDGSRLATGSADVCLTAISEGQ